jgi:hypothetical protein
MRRHQLAVSAAVLSVLVLALTACGPGAPKPSKTPSPEATVSATPTPEPTEAEPEPIVPTCENIVSASTLAGFTSQGVQITPPAEFAIKMANEGNALSAIFDAGGVVCQTGAGLGAFEIYAFGVLSAGQFAPLQSQFLADGMVEQVTDAGILYRVPDDTEGLPRVCYFRPDAFTVCGNDDARIDEIVGVLGLG